jgi:methionyl-tRNA synthetase
MPEPKRYYITTPIYYVNGEPHCGTATTTVLADATKRYHALRGDRPYLLTGTDENARKVMDAAAAAGVETQAFVDDVSQRFVDAWKLLNCDYDVFFRTTEPRHAKVVQTVFERLKATGDIYLGTYEGWYSVADETFFRDTDVDEATQTARETGAKVERFREETYFFRLSAYGDRVREYILGHPDFLLPETRRNEVLAFIDQGLRDIAVTQNRSGWGIPVPGETGRVVYVWFDALINYLTESGWPDPGFETLWPADVHLMAKEIYTRFHATLWPAMLMALDLPLPGHVVGHGWFLVRDPETDKLVKGSKSGVPLPTPRQVVNYLQGQSGASEGVCVDALRYYLARDIAYASDAEFSLEMLISRYNSDLANDFGNVLNRVLRAKYHTGYIPTPRALDAGLQASAAHAVAQYDTALARFDWGAALQAAWSLLTDVNRYLAEKAPWIAAKNGDTEAVGDAVYNALEATRIAALMASPVLPSVAGEIARQLGLETVAAEGSWETARQFGGLNPGAPTGIAEPLFPRIEVKKEAAPVAAPKKRNPVPMSTEPAAVAPAVETPTSDLIGIDDFARVQLRVADIIEADAIPGAKKLLRLQVRLGDNEERQIVSGIADAYTPEELVGRQIVVVYNLKPAVLRGVESQGMLLAATDAEGRAILLQPDKKTEAGSKVK